MNVDELVARAEIHQVLMRYCRAVDRGDIELLRTVYHESGTDLHGSWVGTGYDFAPYIVEKHDAVDLADGVRLIAQHHITNILMEFSGTSADVESYYIAFQPYQKPGKQTTFGIVGGRYLDRFDHRNERWAISERRVIVDWSRASLDGADWPDAANFLQGARREADPSAAFFSTSPTAVEATQ